MPSTINPVAEKVALIVGGGPAGLFAADRIALAGFAVIIADRMPSFGRKFLVAGKGGLNLTNSEEICHMVPKYGSTFRHTESSKAHSEFGEKWRKMLADFGPKDLRYWTETLGVPTFVGTSRRVFPETKQAAPLLRRWVERLRRKGVTFLVRHQFLDWEGGGRGERIQAKFKTEAGEKVVSCDALVLAMGGASWPQTGSNGAWVDSLKEKLKIEPFVSANCGWECDWPEGFGEKYGGLPLKNIQVFCGGSYVYGELLITRYGMEGTALYALGHVLRQVVQKGGKPRISINFKSTMEVKGLLEKLQARGTPKLGELFSAAAKAWNLSPAAQALLQTKMRPDTTSEELANLVLRFQIYFNQPRPNAEAISSSGGVSWSEVSEGLELLRYPGVFCAGEMLDWDAPTGGYLMQGCFTTGSRASRSVIARFKRMR